MDVTSERGGNLTRPMVSHGTNEWIMINFPSGEGNLLMGSMSYQVRFEYLEQLLVLFLENPWILLIHAERRSCIKLSTRFISSSIDYSA